MNTILLITLVVAIPAGLMAQAPNEVINPPQTSFDKPTQTQQDSSSHTIVTLQDVIGGMTDVSTEEVRLGEIFNLDVLGHYNLRNEYDSDLRKNTFMKSQEYADKIAELKAKKQTIIDSGYKYFYNINLTNLTDKFTEKNVLAYNVEKGGFLLYPSADRMDNGMVSPTFWAVYTPQLPTTSVCYGLPQICGRSLLIPLSEEMGLRVEDADKGSDNLENGWTHRIQLYVVFGISRVYKRWDGFAIVANKPRIIIANRDSGEIYYDKIYDDDREAVPMADSASAINNMVKESVVGKPVNISSDSIKPLTQKEELENAIALYRTGKYFEAFPALEKLIKTSNYIAEYYYASCLGAGTQKNKDRAVGIYKRIFPSILVSAKTGDTISQNVVASMYKNGEGVQKSSLEATKWYRKAADQGDAYGQNDLGFMYETGKGIKKDDTAAVVLYRKSADQGLAIAEYNLGRMYENGLGTEKNIAEALNWYQKAAVHNFVGAKEKVDEINTKVRAQEEADRAEADIVENAKSSNVLNSEGDSYMLKSNYSEAIEKYNKANVTCDREIGEENDYSRKRTLARFCTHIMFNLAEAYRMNGDDDQYAEALKGARISEALLY